MAKPGETKTLKNLMPYLNGVSVEVVRQSKSTGGYTVRLTEDAPESPAYPKGTELHVSGYNLA